MGAVGGPASSTDNAVVRYDGTTGKLVQNSGVAIDDSGKVSVGTNAVYGAPVAQFNGANVAITNTAGQFSIGTTDTAAADLGGSLGFTANTTTLAGYPMGSISGRLIATGAGVYRSYMAFATTDAAGSVAERMRLTDAGLNVTGVLGVTQPDSAYTYIRGATKAVRFRASSNGTFIEGVDNTITSSYEPLLVGGSTLDFQIQSSTKMLIDSSGKVGIGTASPAHKLTVSEASTDFAALISNSTSSGNGLKINAGDNSGDSILQLNDKDGNGKMRVLANGNVGIGTTSPDSKLHVRNDGTDVVLAKFQSEIGTNTRDFRIKSPVLDSTTYPFRFTTSNSFAFEVDGVENLRIHSDGNVGIGSTAPTEKLEVAGNVRLDASNAELNIAAGTTGTTGAINFTFTTEDTNYAGIEFVYDTRASVGPRFFSQNGYHLTVDSGDALHLKTDGNDRLIINNGGDVFMHGTTINGTENDAGYSVGGLSFRVSRNTTSNANQIVFYNPNGAIGAIQTNGSATAYNTSSDYRLKENVVPMQDALQRITQLKPSRFNFIADDSVVVDGFLAHEVQEVVPEAISGEKDAMKDEEYEVTPAVLDDDGNETTPAVMDTRSVPDYQGIDQSKLVPLLVGAIQELTARIAALENN